MKSNNVDGFTLVELLAVIVVLAIILAISIPSISGIITNTTKAAFESDANMVLKAIDYKMLEDSNYNPVNLNVDNITTQLKLSNDNYQQITVTIVDNKYRIVIVGKNRWSGLTAYGTIKNILVVNSDDYDVSSPVITILGDNPLILDLGTTYSDAGATAVDLKDGDLTADITVTGTVDVNTAGTYIITYSVSDEAGNTATAVRNVEVIGAYNVAKGVNNPKLITGMTPVKYNGTSWVETTFGDEEWFNYTITDKQWANARTADGSYWVWIPRYVYKISAGWHTATAGTLDIQFSMGTDDTREGTVTLDTGTTAAASDNKWTNHPAFTFGSTELTGIWVAKFEASVSNQASLCYGTPNLNNCDVTTLTPKIISAANQWRYISVGNMFTVTRNMETNSLYGWGTSGSGIDTHLMKNTELGAVAYLGQSTYGRNDEVWINNNSEYITGCAGNTVSATTYDGCQNSYGTTNGVKASTTGTIYGVYDMSGGAHEYTAAFVNNGNDNLALNGSSLINADAKYKDIYAVGGTDARWANYDANMKKGDAIYETSSSGELTTAWYTDLSYMVNSSCPWFIRGGYHGSSTSAGVYAYDNIYGDGNINVSFRPILLVGAGL